MKRRKGRGFQDSGEQDREGFASPTVGDSDAGTGIFYFGGFISNFEFTVLKIEIV